MSISTSRPAFDVDGKWLGSGLALLWVGGVLGVTGAVISAVALARATWNWVEHLEQSPSEIAQRRFGQFKDAVSAGSKAWRDNQSA